TFNTISIPTAEELKDKFAQDFEGIALYRNGRATLTKENGEEKAISQGFYAEPAFPAILSLNLTRGSLGDFTDPSTILISERLAAVLFNQEDPINQTIKINNESSAKVIGVYRNFAPNTDFNKRDFILPWSHLLATRPWVKRAYNRWNNNSFYILAKIAKRADLKKVTNKVKNLLVGKPNRDDHPEIILQPASEWH